VDRCWICKDISGMVLSIIADLVHTSVRLQGWFKLSICVLNVLISLLFLRFCIRFWRCGKSNFFHLRKKSCWMLSVNPLRLKKRICPYIIAPPVSVLGQLYCTQSFWLIKNKHWVRLQYLRV
jgi:hypothetical protein